MARTAVTEQRVEPGQRPRSTPLDAERDADVTVQLVSADWDDPAHRGEQVELLLEKSTDGVTWLPEVRATATVGVHHSRAGGPPGFTLRPDRTVRARQQVRYRVSVVTSKAIRLGIEAESKE